MAPSSASWSWRPAASSSGERDGSATSEAAVAFCSSESRWRGANLETRRRLMQKLRAMV